VLVEKLSLAPSSILLPGPCCAWVSGHVKPKSTVQELLCRFLSLPSSDSLPCVPAQRFVLLGTFGGLYSDEVAWSSFLDFQRSFSFEDGLLQWKACVFLSDIEWFLGEQPTPAMSNASGKKQERNGIK